MLCCCCVSLNGALSVWVCLHAHVHLLTMKEEMKMVPLMFDKVSCYALYTSFIISPLLFFPLLLLPSMMLISSDLCYQRHSHQSVIIGLGVSRPRSMYTDTHQTHEHSPAHLLSFCAHVFICLMESFYSLYHVLMSTIFVTASTVDVFFPAFSLMLTI